MNNKKKEVNKNKDIKLYNKLARAKYAMNISEQKLFLYAVRNIDQDAKEFPESKINISDFAEYADLDIKQLYKDINKMSTRLMQVVIHVEDSGSNKKKWTKYTLTHRCDYDDGVIIFRFNDDMKPFLLGLQRHYFKQAPEIMGFRSWYAFRLYDLLKSQSYQNKGIVVEVDWLKTILDIEEKYSDFTNFKKRVITPAINEINKYSDIEILLCEPIRKGKAVKELSFDVRVEGRDKQYDDLLTGMHDTEEFKKRIGLTPKVLTDMQIIELYEVAVMTFTNHRDMNDLYEYMRINYEYTKDRVTHSNRYPYYKKAIEEDYANAIPQIISGYNI